MLRHCNLCRNNRNMNCPNSSKCFETLDKPYFREKYICQPISLWKRIKLLFSPTYVSRESNKHYTSTIYYKVSNNTIYVIKEELERGGTDV